MSFNPELWTRLEYDGTPIWDELAPGWKICYHTIRAMIEVEERLGRALQVVTS